MKLRVEFQDAVSKNTSDWNWDALKCFHFNSLIVQNVYVNTSKSSILGGVLDYFLFLKSNNNKADVHFYSFCVHLQTSWAFFFGYNVLRISFSKVLLSPELRSLCNIANDGLLEKSFYVSAYYSCKWKYFNKLLLLVFVVG